MRMKQQTLTKERSEENIRQNISETTEIKTVDKRITIKLGKSWICHDHKTIFKICVKLEEQKTENKTRLPGTDGRV